MKRETLGKAFAILGAVLLVSLPWGVINTMYSMYLLFQEVSISGTGDPKIMAGGISSALVSTIVGLILCVPGLLLLLVAIVFFKYRRIWVYRLTLVSSFLLIFMFPVGTILGLVGLMVTIAKRQSFDHNAQAA